jgi:hypothetical protein
MFDSSKKEIIIPIINQLDMKNNSKNFQSHTKHKEDLYMANNYFKNLNRNNLDIREDISCLDKRILLDKLYSWKNRCHILHRKIRKESIYCPESLHIIHRDNQEYKNC